MENSQNKRPNKYVALTTYLIAVVCLLLGLFLPFFGDKGILALQIPDIFNVIAGKSADAKFPFLLSYPVDLFGTGKLVDIMAWVALLYFAVTALSLLALIPIGISTKKGTKTAGIFMYIVEIAAVIVTSVYLIIVLQYQGDAESSIYNISYSMLTALAGSLLMLVLLSTLNKRGTGVAKTFLFLLSAVGLLALYDFSLIIPKLAEIKLAPALFKDDVISTSGIMLIRQLFNGVTSDYLGILVEAKYKAAAVLALMLAIVVLFNFFVDVIGLSSNAKKAGHFFNVVRYGLEFVILICLLITAAVCKYSIGLMLIVLSAAALAQVIISVVRLIMNIRKSKTEEVDKIEFTKYTKRTIMVDPEPDPEPEPEPQPAYSRPAGQTAGQPNYNQPNYNQPDYNQPNYNQPNYGQPMGQPSAQQSYSQPAQPVYTGPERRRALIDKYGFNEPADEEQIQLNIMDLEPEDEQKPVPVNGTRRANEQGTRVYTINTIYGGPTDEFMKKLSNDERIEFAMTFIEKSKGNIGNIPDYVIGGNNRQFFSSVFIYLGRIRGLISDGLLNKMYKELNML